MAKSASNELIQLNEQFDSYYRYQIRRSQPLSAIQEELLLSPSPNNAKKIRRTKQLLNRGIRIQAALQHQVHHQQQHAVEQQQEVHREQQTQQQQFLAREEQIAQQQQRMQQQQQAQEQANLTSLGKLIHRDNLHELISPNFPLETIEKIWFNLVGNYAHLVKNPRNRITHIPEETFWLIANHQEQFSDGIHFDNLPNGFDFTVSEYEGKILSILYYKQTLERDKLHRSDTLLAPQIINPTIKSPLSGIGTVGQFYPFSTMAESYNDFCKQHQPTFDVVYNSTNKLIPLKKRHQALLQLMALDNAALIAMHPEITSILDDFSESNLIS